MLRGGKCIISRFHSFSFRVSAVQPGHFLRRASVLWHFGVILRVNVPAHADGQDHPQQLDKSHSEADSQDDPDVGEEPALHACSTTLIVNGPVWRLSLTEAGVGEVARGERDVLAGAGKQQLGTVGDDHVTSPVRVAAPAAARHIPLDEVPGLLCGGAVAVVVVQHLGDDLGHLFIQLVLMEVDEGAGCYLSDEDQQEAGEVQAQQTAELINGPQAAEEAHEHGERPDSNQDVAGQLYR